MGNCSTCKNCSPDDTAKTDEPGSSSNDKRKQRRSPNTKGKHQNTAVRVAEDEVSDSGDYDGEDESMQSTDHNAQQSDNMSNTQPGTANDITPISPMSNGPNPPLSLDPVVARSPRSDPTLGGIIHWRKVAELSALMSRDIKLKVWNGVFKKEKDYEQSEHKRMSKLLQTFVMLSLTKVE